MKKKNQTPPPRIPKPEWRRRIFYQMDRLTGHPHRTVGLTSIPWCLGIAHLPGDRTLYSLTHLHSGLKIGPTFLSEIEARQGAHIIRANLDTTQPLIPICEQFHKRPRARHQFLQTINTAIRTIPDP